MMLRTAYTPLKQLRRAANSCFAVLLIFRIPLGMLHPEGHAEYTSIIIDLRDRIARRDRTPSRELVKIAAICGWVRYLCYPVGRLRCYFCQ
jgi:hypothetical protein